MSSYGIHKFITLTYSDECLPKDKSLSKPDLQKFFKRLRKNNPTEKFRYFACGEYGEKSKRAHYHAIIYVNSTDYDFDMKKAVEKSWTFGMTHIGGVTPSSIRYVLNYVKKQEVKKIGFYYVEKPFQIMSKGLGERYVKENEDRLSQLGYMSIKGIKYSIPRYFEKKSELISKSKKAIDETIDVKERVPSIAEVDRNIRSEDIRNEQVRKNYYAKKSLSKRSGI
jgi:hypothetical protein